MRVHDCAEIDASSQLYIMQERTTKETKRRIQLPSGVEPIMNLPQGGSSQRTRRVYVQRNVFSNSAQFDLSSATVCHGSCPAVCEPHNFWRGSSHRRALVWRLLRIRLWRVGSSACRMNHRQCGGTLRRASSRSLRSIGMAPAVPVARDAQHISTNWRRVMTPA